MNSQPSSAENESDRYMADYGLDQTTALHNPETTQQTRNISQNNYIGNKIDETKSDETFRIYCGNPNGLNLGRSGGDWTEYCEQVKRLSVDALCLFEVNLDTQKSAVKRKLYDTCQNVFKDHHRLAVASSSVPSTSAYKPGGTLCLTMGNASGRVLETGSDPMGRWSYQTLSCKDGRNMTIISAYQVCEQAASNNGKKRTLTASAQQRSILRQQNRSLSPRKSFIMDMRAFLHAQCAQNNGIFLAGDFNEELDESYDGMTKLCSDFNLTDVMYQTIGHDEFATYIEGSTRLDYALCHDWVHEALQAAGYEPFQYRTKGDHRNMIFDFDSQKLFGNPVYRLDTPAQREFTAKDTSCNRIYIEQKHAYLIEHKFGTRMTAIKTE